jgi:hypothetical protein
VTISQSRPIELRDLPTEGGRESVPVSRTLLNHPVSYARQNPEFRFLPLRWTATLRGSSRQYRIAVGTNCLPEHRPLGSLNRMRLAVYLASSQIRHRLNMIRV